MSKYIKLEDAEKLLTNALRIAQGFDEPLEKSLVDLPTLDIVTCKDCKRCEKELVIERRADGKETIVNLCNKTRPPTIVPLDFYCKDGAKMKGKRNE